MGGIVIQDVSYVLLKTGHPLIHITQAIVRSKQSADNHIKSISLSAKGIIFLGTPHAGTEALATWARGLALSLGLVKQTNPEVLGSLRANSEELYRIQRDFHNLIRERYGKEGDEINITCFFEELPLRGMSVVSPCT